MKKIIFSLAAFLPLLVFSQKDFEGIVTYKGFERGANNQFEGKFFLSKGRIKVKSIHGDSTGKPENAQTIIYNFKSGIQYTLQDEEESFYVDSIDNSSFDESDFGFKATSLTENILGYSCRAYTIISDVESFMSEISGRCWFSDSLKFIIPAKYRGRSSMQTLPDGNMLFLKSIITLRRHPEDDKYKIDSVYVIAQKIERMLLNDSEFLPPAGYTKIAIDVIENTPYLDSLLVDSTSAKELMVDEKIKVQPKKPPPAKSFSPSKSPAKKEKETKPVKG